MYDGSHKVEHLACFVNVSLLAPKHSINWWTTQVSSTHFPTFNQLTGQNWDYVIHQLNQLFFKNQALGTSLAVVKTICFQCSGCEFSPWWRNWNPIGHEGWSKNKKVKNQNQNLLRISVLLNTRIISYLGLISQRNNQFLELVALCNWLY